MSVYGARAVFGFAAVAMAICATVTLVVLEESLLPERRRSRISMTDATPLQGLGILARDRKTCLLAISHSLDKLGAGAYSLWILFTRQVLRWSAVEASMFLSWVGVSLAVNQTCVLRMVVPKLLPVSATVQLGFTLHAVQFACFGLVKSKLSQWALLVITSPGSLADPAIRSALAERDAPAEQGKLQGALSGVEQILTIFSAPVFAALFSVGLKPAVNEPGLPFYVAAFLVLGAAAVASAAFNTPEVGAGSTKRGEGGYELVAREARLAKTMESATTPL